MREGLLLYIFLGAFFPILQAQNDQIGSYNLELLTISQLDSNYVKRFDLSGIVRVEEDIYVIADKSWNHYIYRIDFTPDHWKLVDSISVNLRQSDLEGIDFCPGRQFYLADEKQNHAYIINQKGQAVKIYDYLQDQWPETWMENAGFEAVAVDCENQILYLAKERQPRFIFEVPLNGGEIGELFNFPEDDSNDFADMKFHQGYLYLLERNGNYVTKLDPKTKTVIAKASYRQLGIDSPQKLYEPSKYGMAEALLMTETEIWIGIDNNGLEVSDYAKDKFGMMGSNPAIIKFKRPEGF